MTCRLATLYIFQDAEKGSRVSSAVYTTNEIPIQALQITMLAIPKKEHKKMVVARLIGGPGKTQLSGKQLLERVAELRTNERSKNIEERMNDK